MITDNKITTEEFNRLSAGYVSTLREISTEFPDAGFTVHGRQYSATQMTQEVKTGTLTGMAFVAQEEVKKLSATSL